MLLSRGQRKVRVCEGASPTASVDSQVPAMRPNCQFICIKRPGDYRKMQALPITRRLEFPQQMQSPRLKLVQDGQRSASVDSGCPPF